MRSLIQKTLFWMVMAILAPSLALAHTAIVTCEESDGTCYCRGIFSDLSTATGALITVRDDSGKTLFKGKVDADGEIEFSAPKSHYKVHMDAGAGHEAEWEPEE